MEAPPSTFVIPTEAAGSAVFFRSHADFETPVNSALGHQAKFSPPSPRIVSYWKPRPRDEW
jgi:hypothetical protein